METAIFNAGGSYAGFDDFGFCVPILLVIAIALSLWGAYKFPQQQD